MSYNQITARTHIGGKDLYLGIPSIESAVVESVVYDQTIANYSTKINLRLANGELYVINIVQEK